MHKMNVVQRNLRRLKFLLVVVALLCGFAADPLRLRTAAIGMEVLFIGKSAPRRFVCRPGPQERQVHRAALLRPFADLCRRSSLS